LVLAFLMFLLWIFIFLLSLIFKRLLVI